MEEKPIPPLRILLLEDEPTDAELVENELREAKLVAGDVWKASLSAILDLEVALQIGRECNGYLPLGANTG